MKIIDHEINLAPSGFFFFSPYSRYSINIALHETPLKKLNFFHCGVFLIFFFSSLKANNERERAEKGYWCEPEVEKL